MRLKTQWEILPEDYHSDEQFETSENSKHCESDLLSGVVKGTMPEEPPLSEVSRRKYYTRMEAVGSRHPKSWVPATRKPTKLRTMNKTILKMNTNHEFGGEGWRIKRVNLRKIIVLE